MASLENVWQAQLIIPHRFRNILLLQKALTAGDTNSDDREGHRGLSQVGDGLMSFVILNEGFQRGLSRKEQADYHAILKSKEWCSLLARGHRLHQLVKISERQVHDGPQPTTLKNLLSAIIAAVWRDSHDYAAVTRVMSFLGLVNNLDHSSYPHDSTPAGWTLLPPDENLDSSTCPYLSDGVMSDVNFENFLNTDLLGPEWSSVGLHENECNDWFAVDATQDSGKAAQLVPLETISGADVLIHGVPQAEADPIYAGPSTLHAGNVSTQPYLCINEAVHEAANVTNENWNEVEHETMPNMAPITQTQESRSRITTVAHENKRPRTRKASHIRMAFKSHLSLESWKFHDQLELFEQYCGHMNAYQEALSSIKSDRPNALATMVLAIGDFSAMSMLKQAIQGIKSPSFMSYLPIRRNMSPKERLDAIEHLDLCMAHLRIVRWLHIYQLYEEASSEVGGKDADNFVNITSADLGNGSSEPGAPSQHGNPRNLEQATITRRMMDHADFDNTDDQDRKKVQSSMTRLRRIGRKLQSMVKLWGPGIFALLGSGFTDDIMKNVADATFAELLNVVERFEGELIRSLSQAAMPSLSLFMNDGIAQPELQIEAIDLNRLEQLPRLSKDMDALFTVNGGI